MLAGELYDPFDAELVAARERARDLCLTLNGTREAQQAERRRILEELLGSGGDSARAVIGAGSVVTRDIPDGAFAAGNPCRVVRETA